MDKYEDALARAKELHEAGNGLTKTQMEIVFPELKESNDEKIRKSLLCYFKHWARLYWNDLNVNDIIAYLEKQKE